MKREFLHIQMADSLSEEIEDTTPTTIQDVLIVGIDTVGPNFRQHSTTSECYVVFVSEDDDGKRTNGVLFAHTICAIADLIEKKQPVIQAPPSMTAVQVAIDALLVTKLKFVRQYRASQETMALCQQMKADGELITVPEDLKFHKEVLMVLDTLGFQRVKE